MKRGQKRGPFRAGVNILPSGSLILFGVSIDEKDWMKYGGPNDDFGFLLNGDLIEMGRSRMYEIDEPIKINSFSFKEDAPDGVIVDYIIF